MQRTDLVIPPVAQRELDRLAAIAQPLDEWCEFCTTKLAVMKTADGVGACQECAEGVLAAMAKYAADASFLRSQEERPAKPVSAQKAKAKAKRRAKRKRTKR